MKYKQTVYITSENTHTHTHTHTHTNLQSVFCSDVVCGQMSKKTSLSNTYGWARAEVLGALVNSVFLIALCFTILVEAIQRLTHSHPIEHVDSMIYVGVAGFIVNVLGLILFYSYGQEQSTEDRGECQLDDSSQENSPGTNTCTTMTDTCTTVTDTSTTVTDRYTTVTDTCTTVTDRYTTVTDTCTTMTDTCTTVTDTYTTVTDTSTTVTDSNYSVAVMSRARYTVRRSTVRHIIFCLLLIFSRPCNLRFFHFHLLHLHSVTYSLL